jgi:hypothetical protein
MQNRASDGNTGIDGYLFRLIATFEAAAMQQLGKIAHPITGGVEIDLAGARDSIEMLVAIQRKTTGNLNEDEKRLLEHVLYQLRMNYVDVNSEQTRAAGAETDGRQEGAPERESAPEGDSAPERDSTPEQDSAPEQEGED